MLKKKFERALPGVAKLREGIAATTTARGGWLKGLDGRILRVRSAHSALNTLLQSAGAVVMKKALCILDEDLQALGLRHCGVDYEFALQIHDEMQIEVREKLAETVGKMAVRAIEKAGEALGFRCPLTGEFHVGKTWAETH